jgi:hypothetical protein
MMKSTELRTRSMPLLNACTVSICGPYAFQPVLPDPGSGAFLTPGSGMENKMRIRDEHPIHF